MGAYGDSLTASPSFVDNLRTMAGVNTLFIATGGDRTDQLLVDVLASSVPASSQLSLVMIGINDVIQNIAAETIEANQAAILAEIPNPVVVTLLPFGNSADWTSGREAVRVAVNAWIAANVDHYVDAESLIGDGTPGQPALKTAYDSGDGKHINGAGDEALALLILGSEAFS